MIQREIKDIQIEMKTETEVEMEMEIEIESVSFHKVNLSRHSVSGVPMNILSSLMHTVFFKLRSEW